ncbi:hypothetical protein HELRODRAFT_164092 [Helobdella robusta]|uniref:Uncharacterized protein n=1 Tax=Helobdella robusta TaxID=6412 RepID=T1EUX1_HELRO|nr:hypothetical protein HELRODRAFT_164092 [Helobdella robusta]ESN94281.1 hypothetical protein HELRODRAFT_164092 [Helobdella robusta]
MTIRAYRVMKYNYEVLKISLRLSSVDAVSVKALRQLENDDGHGLQTVKQAKDYMDAPTIGTLAPDRLRHHKAKGPTQRLPHKSDSSDNCMLLSLKKGLDESRRPKAAIVQVYGFVELLHGNIHQGLGHHR